MRCRPVLVVSTWLSCRVPGKTYDDCVADGGDAVDNGHQDISDGSEDALDTADYCAHCDVCNVVGGWMWCEVIIIVC